MGIKQVLSLQRRVHSWAWLCAMVDRTLSATRSMTLLPARGVLCTGTRSVLDSDELMYHCEVHKGPTLLIFELRNIPITIKRSEDK